MDCSAFGTIWDRMCAKQANCLLLPTNLETAFLIFTALLLSHDLIRVHVEILYNFQ